jgi:hypothetical protein
VRLRATPTVGSGIRWYTDREVTRVRDKFDEGDDSHLQQYGQIASHTEENLRGDAARRMARCVKVGEGVEGSPFAVLCRVGLSGLTYPAEFWFDPDAHDTLFCSLNANCPPHLWFPVGRTLDSIATATAVYFTGRPADPPENPAQYAARIRQQSSGREVPDDWTTTRMLLGMVGDMAEEENRFIRRPAFCRGFDSIATGPDENRMVPLTVFHTLQTFSRIRLEYHRWLQYDDGEGGTISPVVAEIAYPACPHGDLIRVYNAAMDNDVPEDVPVDVLGALFGYPIKGLPRLYRVLDPMGQPGDITYTLGLLVATEGHNPTLQACLREFSTHASPQVRAKVVRHANITRNEELLRDMLEREQDPAVREMLVDILEPMAEEE